LDFTVPAYVFFSTSEICFFREISECFLNLESNGRVFKIYGASILQKIQEIRNIMNSFLLPF
jgi:hypothetical protein